MTLMRLSLTSQPPVRKPLSRRAKSVEKLDQLKPALERALAAVKGGKTAILNVVVSR